MRYAPVLAGVGLLFAASGWSAGADTGSPTRAAWKEQHLRFIYIGRTSLYSCDGLRDKVRAMLLDLGARRDLSITALGCEAAAAQVRRGSVGPSLTIVFSSLQAGDLGAVDARYETFTITSDAFHNMEIADCELVEEFAHQVLPKLATRNLKQDISCVPFQQSGGRFLIRGEVLRALPAR
jgi:hypothetical protein